MAKKYLMTWKRIINLDKRKGFELHVCGSREEMRKIEGCHKDWLGFMDETAEKGDIVGAVVLNKEDLTHDIIMHEITHICLLHFKKKGLCMYDKNEEKFCYLIGRVAKQVYSALKLDGYNV